LKDSTEILTRARELVYAEMERRLAEAQLRLPHRCVHNHRQSLDLRRTVEGEPNPTFNRVLNDGSQTIGLCMLGSSNPDDWQGTICEDPIDAQRCPYFVPVLSKDQVLETFRQDLSDPEWVGQHMPELATLFWVLDTNSLPQLPWFRRLLLRFRSFQVEPLRPATDPAQLLSDLNP
jgi:hypothetical protein